jgi:hypothetical protein
MSETEMTKNQRHYLIFSALIEMFFIQIKMSTEIYQTSINFKSSI